MMHHYQDSINGILFKHTIQCSRLGRSPFLEMTRLEQKRKYEVFGALCFYTAFLIALKTQRKFLTKWLLF